MVDRDVEKMVRLVREHHRQRQAAQPIPATISPPASAAESWPANAHARRALSKLQASGVEASDLSESNFEILRSELHRRYGDPRVARLCTTYEAWIDDANVATESFEALLSSVGTEGRRIVTELLVERPARGFLVDEKAIIPGVWLALAIWSDCVMARSWRRRQRALSAAPLNIIAALASPKDRRVVEGGQVVYRGSKIPLSLSRAPSDLLIHDLPTDLTFYRLLGFLTAKQREKFAITGDAAGASVLDFQNMTALATGIGLDDSAESCARVRDALRHGRLIESPRDRNGGFEAHGLWSAGIGDATSKKGEAIRVSLGPVLHVDVASFMPRTEKLLAPIADPAVMPRYAGGPRGWSAQAHADQLLYCWLTERSVDAEIDNGQVVFAFSQDVDGRRIASTAGMSNLNAWFSRLIEASSELPEPVGRHPILSRVDTHHIKVRSVALNDFWSDQRRLRRLAIKRSKRKRLRSP